MTFDSLIEATGIFLDSFFSSIEFCLTFFFEDLPVLFGLPLGWWFILFGLLALFVNRLTGGNF